MNRQGTVYERKDGRWVAALSLDSRQRVTRYCATKAAAELALARRLAGRRSRRIWRSGSPTNAPACGTIRL